SWTRYVGPGTAGAVGWRAAIDAADGGALLRCPHPSAIRPSATNASTLVILRCISPLMAPPISAAQSFRKPSSRPIQPGSRPAAHQADRELDCGSLPEKVEKNLHAAAFRARPLHHRDEASEGSAAYLHPVASLERRSRPDDAALVPARRDERDHVVLHGSGRR